MRIKESMGGMREAVWDVVRGVRCVAGWRKLLVREERRGEEERDPKVQSQHIAGSTGLHTAAPHISHS